jgi:hypothetical protein
MRKLKYVKLFENFQSGFDEFPQEINQNSLRELSNKVVTFFKDKDKIKVFNDETEKFESPENVKFGISNSYFLEGKHNYGPHAELEITRSKSKLNIYFWVDDFAKNRGLGSAGIEAQTSAGNRFGGTEFKLENKDQLDIISKFVVSVFSDLFKKQVKKENIEKTIERCVEVG